MENNTKLKIFLAEDEFVIREGIKKNIDWDSHGYIFVGDAQDGELALPIIKKEQPDILITDIRMPFMDGLELSRLVKKEFPNTEIIILSGFEEFAYAKEAIKIGVSEYLTKPISANELLAGIDKVAEGIRKKRLEEELKAQYIKEMQENVRLEKKDLFKSLVSGGSSVSTIMKMADAQNVSIMSMRYCLILLKLLSSHHADGEFSGTMVTVDERLESTIAQLGNVSFDRTPDGKAYLFMADSDEDIQSKILAFKRTLNDSLAEFSSITYFGAEGKIVNRISEIPESYAGAIRAFAYRFFDKPGHFVSYRDISENTLPTRDNFDVTSIDPKQLQNDEVETFLKTGSAEEASFFVDAFLLKVGESALNSNMFRQYLVMNAYFCVVEFIESIGRSREEIESFSASSEFLKTTEETRKYLTRILSEAISLREQMANNRYSVVVNEVYKYVETHYYVEDLSLNMIAAAVNFSPSHLSMIFSQETGQPLIKYITDFRMIKAKELLRCTSLRSNEISLKVGYQDPHYFSYLFKKTQGITPTDYRGGKNGEDDI